MAVKISFGQRRKRASKKKGAHGTETTRARRTLGALVVHKSDFSQEPLLLNAEAFPDAKVRSGRPWHPTRVNPRLSAPRARAFTWPVPALDCALAGGRHLRGVPQRSR